MRTLLTVSAIQGYLDVIKYVLTKYQISNTKFIAQKAIEYGHVDIVTHLLENGSWEKTNDVAMICAESGQLEMFMKFKGAEVEKMKLMKAAARNGHLDFVKYVVWEYSVTKEDILKDMNDNSFKHNYYSTSILECCARQGNVGLAKYILEKFDISKDDIQPSLNGILHAAAGHWGLVKYLIDKYMDL